VPMLAELVDVVIGVDTHQDTHSASMVNSVGAELAAVTVMADPAGYRRLLDWAVQHAANGRLVWAIEGSRSHGTGLLRVLKDAGHSVVEADRPQRNRRPQGKSDSIDARRAATAALAREHHAVPLADGPREAARILLVTRASAVQARTAALNALKALITTASDQDRQKLRGLSTPAQLRACLRLRARPADSVEDCVRRTAMKRLAGRITDLTSEIRDADTEFLALARIHIPQLLQQRGVGVITATQAWISWSEPGRFRNEAAFAALAGASPLPAAAAAPSDTASTAAATAPSTRRSTTSPSPWSAATPTPTPTSPGAPPKARAARKSAAASSATSPESSTAYSKPVRIDNPHELDET
jgi:transposase